MTDIALKMDHVYKKFSKGERHDSLRDLIPALTKVMFRRIASPSALKQEEFWALNDVTFDIKKGEAVGIVGHNGAGKSTMLKHLSGLMKPTKGSISVSGRLSALIEVGAGFHHDLTGRENIFLNGVILGMSRAEVRRKLDEIIDFCGLAEFIDTPVKRYSSGMYARLGFSVAAHMEPDILVIDEVLSVGDYAFQAKGVEKMRSIANNGATIIFVSHNLRAMADLCPRSLLLRRGQLIGDGPTSQIVRDYMEQNKAQRTSLSDDKKCVIEKVTIYGDDDARMDFEAGEKAIVEVSIKAIKRAEKVACIFIIKDENDYQVFNTSSQRLGVPSVNLEEGEQCVCRFHVDLHLAAGSFNVCVYLYRYDIEYMYDEVAPATTLLIHSATDVRGAAHLYPRAEFSK